jgi:hypothetical protein
MQLEGQPIISLLPHRLARSEATAGHACDAFRRRCPAGRTSGTDLPAANSIRIWPRTVSSTRRLNAAVRELARERRLPLVDAASELSGPANFTEFVHFI